jgi:two-component system sensor histidine kinase/response regulator
VLTDISQLKSAPDPLGKISLAIEQSPESIRIADPQAHFDFVNDAMLSASGCFRNELPGNQQQHLHVRKGV